MSGGKGSDHIERPPANPGETVSPGGDPSSQLEVGVVIGAHGVDGALRVRLHHSQSESLRVGVRVTLTQVGESARRAEIKRTAVHPGTSTVRVWIDGVHSRNEAEACRGATVSVSRAADALDADEYYLTDLVGLEVVGDDTSIVAPGRSIGRVRGITSNGAQDLLEIEWRRRDGVQCEWLLPVLPMFVVDFDDQRVLVSVPEGFLPAEVDV